MLSYAGGGGILFGCLFDGFEVGILLNK
jgi:hypothetical protein